MLTLLLASMLMLAFHVQSVKAEGTIYIMADGSIEPTTAPIQRNGDIFTLTNNINSDNDGIVIERDNIVVDGAGYMLNGSGNGIGINLTVRNHVTLRNMSVGFFSSGIMLYDSTNNTIEACEVTENYMGIDLVYFSHHNNLYDNSLTNNTFGIALYWSDYNSIFGNTMKLNEYGIRFQTAEFDDVFCNNFIDNEEHVQFFSASEPIYWFYLEGNYWSNYTGADLNHDGIGDDQYTMMGRDIANDYPYWDNDMAPLMGLFSRFSDSLGHFVNVISNSTITGFEFIESNSTIRMQVSNSTPTQDFGFCRIGIPHSIMDVSNISAIVDDGETQVLYPNFTLRDSGISIDNETYRWIYFAYRHSTHEVIIAPEFPTFLILPLFMIATLLAVIAYKRKHCRTD